MKPQRNALFRSGLLVAHAGEIAVVQRVADGGLILAVHWLLCSAYDTSSWNQLNWLATAVAVIGFYLFAETQALYRPWRGASLMQEGWQVIWTWALTVPVLLFLGFATKTTMEFSRAVTVAWFVAAPITLVMWRAGFRALLSSIRSRGHNTRRVGIAGATACAQRLAETLTRSPSLGLQVHGIYDDRIKRRHAITEAPVLGDLDRLVEHAKGGELDVVYVTLPLRAETRITQLVSRLADTTATVYIVPEFHAYDLLGARWQKVGQIPVVSIFDSPFHGLGGWYKRTEDLLLGSIALCIVAIPMLFIALAIKLDSRGPVFFRQTRYGLNGKPIRVWKFRTMTVCEDGDVVHQATRNDCRITRTGEVLRRLSLDELPQLFNVLAGGMSLVGPRPHAVAHNEAYRAKIHGYMLRHKVKPGITGWAQVNGWRGETDTIDKMEQRIAHDLSYIHNWSLLLDIKIIFMTVFDRRTWKNAY